MNWLSAIRGLVEQYPDGDSRVLARKLLEQLDHEELITVIAEEIEHHQRAIARHTERASFLQALSPHSTVAAMIAGDRGEWAALLATPFRLGDREQVVWGRASVEQHEQRIALLTKLRDGLDRTIAFHREAITLITDAGVTCLDEVDAAA
jgi:hypothetical protein